MGQSHTTHVTAPAPLPRTDTLTTLDASLAVPGFPMPAGGRQ